MISEEPAFKDTQVLAAVTVNVGSVNNGSMFPIQMMDVFTIEPGDNLSARVEYRFHPSSLLMPNAAVNPGRVLRAIGLNGLLGVIWQQ